MMRIPDQLWIRIKDYDYFVDTNKYIKAKTLDLIDFGFKSVTDQDVRESIARILSNRKNTKIVIDAFIAEDIVTAKNN